MVAGTDWEHPEVPNSLVLTGSLSSTSQGSCAGARAFGVFFVLKSLPTQERAALGRNLSKPRAFPQRLSRFPLQKAKETGLPELLSSQRVNRDLDICVFKHFPKYC